MRAGTTRRWARHAAVAAALALPLAVATAARADDPGTLRGEAEQVRAANNSLAAESQQALLDLYSLETRLAGAERQLATLENRSREVERRQTAARNALEVARRNAAEAERRLASRLQILYVEGDVDPLAVLLGAESFDEALTALDGLGRVAADDRAIVTEVRAARNGLQQAVRALDARRTELAKLVAAARTTRDALAQAHAERTAYVARLRGRQTFNNRLVGQLLAQAAAAETKTEQISPAPTQESSPSRAPAPEGGTRMIVFSTGYCLRGSTATGMKTGWGTIAVDPAVIPLGTRMNVPGYGDGVAADTGSAVRGRMIDVWFPTCAQALAWGGRTVAITLK